MNAPLPLTLALPRRAALRRLAALALAPGAAHAAPGGLPSATHEATSPEWERLHQRMFPGRPLIQGQGTVQVIAPLRAAYGASVPVKVVSRLAQRPELYVRKLYLIVDKNPSPVAAMLDLTTAVGQADFETRLRVDEYSHVRVVSELSNGELHTDSRYVKTSGGCSAPPNREALHLIGKTILKVAGKVQPGKPMAAEVTVVHPNDTGFELNQLTVMYIPPYFVRSMVVSFAQQPIFAADLDFSVSENPTLRFNFVPQGPGELRAEVTDTKDAQFVGTLLVG
ncbi:quinoprotein dehydrogenase-associated SoxYZ-like carrier [Polaromonas sp.]|uniref:quinoprotein dehydrogenase-associated SoxYZ-like carrier n=1 Tax=Polaromonas sp. TaxID=1869339 RepID=UPI002B5BB084|nr:quinoprotein dehydrogenase-associated SoxYZ-like carrier [Polaromonas sp.]HQS32517.1 quinoprotein dehydrogenase-associated SoxYZ-like carrier [Polaromonas sp.]HQS91756.1 quinoprotein dehydrogenase-associated SoxYZ-like carrier [Polaromonas sp.]